MADNETTEGDAGISRRDALKKGALGAGVIGLVWAAPAIEGLTLAPAYAAGGSGGCTGNFAFDVPLASDGGAHAATPKTSGCVSTLTTSDYSSPHQTITSNIVAGGPGCTFTSMDFQTGADFFGVEVTSPTPGSQTISAQFESDPGNFGGDLGAPHWGSGAHAHIVVTCT